MFWTRPPSPASGCALLVAIPLDRDEFGPDAARPTDFVRAYAADAERYGQDPWKAYQPHAARYRDVVSMVARHGVSVVRRATLGALAHAMTRFQTVTLVAHARGPEIEPRDVIEPAAVIAKRHAVSEALGLSDGLPDGAADAERLGAWLDAGLGPADVDQPAGVADTTAFAWRVALYRRRWDRRRLVERLCPGALGGGPAIEFHDGLVGIDDVSAALPWQFHTLDLTVCDSVLLAERLRADRPEGVILANPRPTTPDFRLVLYGEIIRFIVRHRVAYQDAAIQLRRHLRRPTCRQ